MGNIFLVDILSRVILSCGQMKTTEEAYHG
jgi:hypothetical protein